MKIGHAFLTGGILALSLAACDQQKSTAESARDVSKAQQEASKDVADASKKAATEVDEAQRKLDEGGGVVRRVIGGDPPPVE